MRPPLPRLRVLAALFAAASVAPAGDYRVGAGKADITPAHPIRLNGFGFRRAESEGVEQRLFARALAVDTGDGAPAVLVVADVLGVPADLCAELARRLQKKGVRPERLAITATHTHCGPMLAGANQCIFGAPIPEAHRANIAKYTPTFVDGLEAAALAALSDLRPATLRWGVGTVGFASNRRRGGGPTDHSLPVLVAKDASGKVRAVYASYACHAVTLSHNRIGGDWPGYAAAAIEADFPGAVALVSIGCGADQNPISGVTGGKVEVAAEQGRAVAAEARRVAGQFLAPVRGPLVSRSTTLDLPLADLPDRAEWRKRAERADAAGHHARVTLAQLERGERPPASVPYPVRTWAFGDSLAMVHLPGEVVVDYAARLKRELDGVRLWVTAYANGAPCYIPSERVLKEGGYEGGGAMIYYDLPAPFRPGLEQKIVDAVRGQLLPAFAPRFDPDKTGGTRPMSPQQSLAALRPRAGVRADLMAAEPLVADPVALAFGADGRLWVAEMADYPGPSPAPAGRVVALTDADGDGRFDRSAVFLDGLPLPTGLLPWRRGLLVCAAPDILYAEDADGDGRAERVEKLYSGFGTSNFQARVNGLQYGLDGWVYGSCGLFGGDITCHKTGKVVALGDRDFRIRPDAGELEPATGRTQQGRTRDDAGNWFGCDNSQLARHYPLADHEVRRNPHAAAAVSAVPLPLVNRVFPLKADAQRFRLSGPPGGVTAACGLAAYRDDLFGADATGDLFACEPVGLVVTRLRLAAKGSTFAGRRAAGEEASEFLASSDNWFRPVQAVTGPDGGLWVADMYRYLIEHPRWIPPEDLARIDPRAGAGMGRIVRLLPDGAAPRPWARLDRLDARGLVAALDSPNGWQRDTATQLLIWRGGDEARAPLEAAASGAARPLARLHALVALDGLGLLRPGTVAALLADADPAVRRHAVRLAPRHLSDGRVADALLARAADPDAQVRLQLAAALGEWADRRAGRLLGALAAGSAGDPVLQAAVASSLTAANLPSVADALLRPDAGPPPAGLVRDLLATAAAHDAVLPAALAALGRGAEPWRLAAAAAALDALERRGRPWEKLPADVRAAIAPLADAAREALGRPDAAPEVWVAALPLAGRDPARRAGDVARVVGMLTASRPAAVQSAATTALGRVGDADAVAALTGAWSGATPETRGRILDALLQRPAGAAALLAAAEAGAVPPGQVDAARRQRLLAHADPAVRDRAGRLFAGAPSPDRAKVLADYESAATRAGDPGRGRAVFARACAACHRLGGDGAAVGPDLAALSGKSPRYLLGEILDPSRNLDSRYAEYRADTADGRTVAGVLAAETATSVTLRGAQGREETVLRADLERLRATGRSLMPDGLEKDVAPPEMADLLAYLAAPAPRPEFRPAGGRLTLAASDAARSGPSLAFEPEFRNLGYWHTEADAASWDVRLDAPAAFEVSLEYACADGSAGNRLRVEGAGRPLAWAVRATGPGWDRYATARVGEVRLPAGVTRLTVRADGPVRGALIDLRAVHLGPPVPAAPPAELAATLLDESAPRDRREAAARDAAGRAGEVVRAVAAGMPADPKEEYRRIPWLWRVALNAGRANDAAALRDLLDAALPPPGAELRHWRAVVLGGGVVNGLSLEGVWPRRRLAELLAGRPDLEARWAGALRQAHAMADAAGVPAGTRYDALRVAALDAPAAALPRLTTYLAKGADPELQQGAVSGLSDVESPEVGPLLAAAMPGLAARVRPFAADALLRTPDRARALLDAAAAGRADAAWLTPDQWSAARSKAAR